jgi:hypothetical protein
VTYGNRDGRRVRRRPIRNYKIVEIKRVRGHFYRVLIFLILTRPPLVRATRAPSYRVMYVEIIMRTEICVTGV